MKEIGELLPELAKNRAFRKALRQSFGEQTNLILEAFAEGEFPESIERSHVTVEINQIFDDGREVVLTLYAPGGPELGPFAVNIMSFAGVYWIQPLEGGDIGYFATKEDALDCAQTNWSYELTEDEDDPSLWE